MIHLIIVSMNTIILHGYILVCMCKKAMYMYKTIEVLQVYAFIGNNK